MSLGRDSSRVILGYGGQSGLFHGQLKSVYALLGLLCLAMLTRVSADWIPELRMSFIGFAALVWILGIVIWSSVLFRYLGQKDSE